MIGLAVAAVLTYGLIRAAAAEPDRKRRVLEGRLSVLATVRPERLTLAQAEDGAAIARRLGKKELEDRFARRAAAIKSSRRRLS